LCRPAIDPVKEFRLSEKVRDGEISILGERLANGKRLGLQIVWVQGHGVMRFQRRLSSLERVKGIFVDLPLSGPLKVII